MVRQTTILPREEIASKTKATAKRKMMVTTTADKSRSKRQASLKSPPKHAPVLFQQQIVQFDERKAAPHKIVVKERDGGAANSRPRGSDNGSDHCCYSCHEPPS